MINIGGIADVFNPEFHACCHCAGYQRWICCRSCVCHVMMLRIYHIADRAADYALLQCLRWNTITYMHCLVSMTWLWKSLDLNNDLIELYYLQRSKSLESSATCSTVSISSICPPLFFIPYIEISHLIEQESMRSCVYLVQDAIKAVCEILSHCLHFVKD